MCIKNVLVIWQTLMFLIHGGGATFKDIFPIETALCHFLEQIKDTDGPLDDEFTAEASHILDAFDPLFFQNFCD